MILAKKFVASLIVLFVVSLGVARSDGGFLVRNLTSAYPSLDSHSDAGKVISIEYYDDERRQLGRSLILVEGDAKSIDISNFRDLKAAGRVIHAAVEKGFDPREPSKWEVRRIRSELKHINGDFRENLDGSLKESLIHYGDPNGFLKRYGESIFKDPEWTVSDSGRLWSLTFRSYDSIKERLIRYNVEGRTEPFSLESIKIFGMPIGEKDGDWEKLMEAPKP